MKSEIRVLVVNCGSSSLKYRVLRMPGEEELSRGEVQRVGIRTADRPFVTHVAGGRESVREVAVADHGDAFRVALECLDGDRERDPAAGFDVVAHRYVHGGERFGKAALVDEDAFRRLGETLDLAPIHNPVSFGLIGIGRRERPDVPQYAVFDTAFHATIPPALGTYALPQALAAAHGLRRVGFHGISHEFVTGEACRFTGRDPAATNIVSCHLGSGGASVCAIERGRSIYSSMGFTPLEGLVMNTRSGDIDAGLALRLMFDGGLSVDGLDEVLNRRSGILAVYGRSSDLRDALRHETDDPRARAAVRLFTRRIRKYVGFAALLLGGPDLLVFTDSLGVESAVVRARVSAGLEYLGIALDAGKNNAYTGGNADVSAAGSAARVLVVPTNEEVMIARAAYEEHVHDRRN